MAFPACRTSSAATRDGSWAGSQAAGQQAHAAAKAGAEKINRAGGIARRVESVDDVKDIIAQADREEREEGHHVVS